MQWEQGAGVAMPAMRVDHDKWPGVDPHCRSHSSLEKQPRDGVYGGSLIEFNCPLNSAMS